MMILNVILLIQLGQAQINDCKKAHDNALGSMQYVGSPGFPRLSKDTYNCKYTISVNYGVWIKLSGDMIDIPCVGSNGVYIEEKGGRAGPFCSKKKMPAFVSRDVFFDIHIVVDTPLAPGWRVKIGYKQIKGQNGPKLPSSKGKLPPPIMNSMDLGRLPDQGQGMLQQTNKQNFKVDKAASQGQIFVDQDATPQEFDQRQPQNMRNSPPEELLPTGGVGRGGAGGPGAGGRGRPKLKSANKRTWESETWNGDKEPVFKTLGKPKLGLDTPKDNGGGGIIMAVILLILLICVAIFLVHKRQQMIKEEMKKQDEEVLKAQEASKPSVVKTDTYKPEPAIDTKPNEPTVDEINACVEHATKNMTESKDSGCVEETIAAKEPKRTTSEESVGKESQATTAPSISEYPKPPERKKRTGMRGPPGR